MHKDTHHLPPRAFFDHAPETVAPNMLGAILVCKRKNAAPVSGRIVETEAYLAHGDPAAHHVTRGRTAATQAKFMRAGTIYIHRIHRHFCLDIVTQGEDIPSSVLIRALEPTTGLDAMKAQRSTHVEANLTNGPGKLCQALDIDSRFNCADILATDCELQLLVPKTPLSADEIANTRRIGLSNGKDLPLRYFLKRNPYVSGTKALNKT